MKNTEEQEIEYINELLKNFVSAKKSGTTSVQRVLYEMFDCSQLEVIDSLGSKYQNVKDFFEKKLYKLDIFHFEHFWEFS